MARDERSNVRYADFFEEDQKAFLCLWDGRYVAYLNREAAGGALAVAAARLSERQDRSSPRSP